MAARLSLHYWPGRGLMEPVRQMLAAAGKFPPADYDNFLYTAKDAEGKLPEGVKDVETPELTAVLAANLGRMPIATVGDVAIGQGAAICQYIAAEHGFNGSSTLDAAQITGVAESLAEVKKAYQALVPYGSTPSAETLDKWFNEGATDAEGRAAYGGTRYLTWFLGRIEASLSGAGGFAFGGKLSLADFLLYNAFVEQLKAEEIVGDKPAGAEPYGSTERMTKALEKHPKIKASTEAVAANEGVKKWLATRGPQGF